MDKLDKLINRLQDFESEILWTIRTTMQENVSTLLDMNIQDQLYNKGITREDIKISSYAPYAESTIRIKKMKGQPTARVTLRDEQDFHNSFYTEFRDDEMEIKALDWKSDFLEFQYGSEIFGLTDQNRDEFARDYIAPELETLFETL